MISIVYVPACLPAEFNFITIADIKFWFYIVHKKNKTFLRWEQCQTKLSTYAKKKKNGIGWGQNWNEMAVRQSFNFLLTSTFLFLGLLIYFKYLDPFCDVWLQPECGCAVFYKSSIACVSGHYQARTHWRPPTPSIISEVSICAAGAECRPDIRRPPVLPAVTNKLLPKEHTVCYRGTRNLRLLAETYLCVHAPRRLSARPTLFAASFHQERGLVCTFSRPLSHSTTERQNHCCLLAF